MAETLGFEGEFEFVKIKNFKKVDLENLNE